jgi:hypothetical protein
MNDAYGDEVVEEFYEQQLHEDERPIDLTAVDPALFSGFVGLAERQPTHPTVVALRLAVEIIDARREARRAHIEASHDVAEGTDWRRYADNRVDYAELQRRRDEPAQVRPAEVDDELRTAWADDARQQLAQQLEQVDQRLREIRAAAVEVHAAAQQRRAVDEAPTDAAETGSATDGVADTS